MTTETAAPFLNIFDPEFHYEHQSIADAREQNWFAETPLGPMILRNEDAWALLRDRRLVPGGQRYMYKIGITQGPVYDWFIHMLASLPPTDHGRLRGLVAKAFSPAVIESLRPAVQTIATTMANDIGQTGESCEFVSVFAEPLPALVMCELLGVPTEDYELFHRWANEIGLIFNTTAELPRSEAAIVGLSEYVDTLLERRRWEPGDDLISALIHVEEAGDHLTPAELHNLLVLLVWAAQDTTARQLGRAIVAFAQHPDQWDLLHEQPDLTPQAVEEVCRWSPQARVTFRAVNEDLRYRDLDLPTDAFVLFSIAAANRDPRIFDEPDDFNIRLSRKSRQLVFGAGPYTCLGTALARLELVEGLAALVSAFEPPVVTGPVTWGPPTAMIHGPHVLPVQLVRRSG